MENMTSVSGIRNWCHTLAIAMPTAHLLAIHQILNSPRYVIISMDMRFWWQQRHAHIRFPSRWTSITQLSVLSSTGLHETGMEEQENRLGYFANGLVSQWTRSRLLRPAVGDHHAGCIEASNVNIDFTAKIQFRQKEQIQHLFRIKFSFTIDSHGLRN